MNAKEIKEKYPKSIESLKSFTKKYLDAFCKTIPVEENIDMPEIAEEIIEKSIDIILIAQCRTLYDFFDEHRIVAEVVFDSHLFHKSIYGNKFDNKAFSKRVEAEDAVFIEAFETLEEKL